MRNKIATFFVAIVMLASHIAFAQTSQLFLISPAPGARIAAGGVLTVTVDMTPRDSVRMVSIVGSIGQIHVSKSASSASKNSLPATFHVSIPDNVRIGKHTVIGIAVTADGRTLETAPMFVEITAPLNVVGIQSDSESLYFEFRGQTGRLGAYVLDAEGLRRYVDNAMELSCVTSNPQIVGITQHCTPVAVSNGDALITASYRGMSVVVPASVSISPVRGDLSGDGVVDLVDIDMLTSMVGQAVTFRPNDMDLNSDGKIDALDLRILTTLCSKPRCASE